MEASWGERKRKTIIAGRKKRSWKMATSKFRNFTQKQSDRTGEANSVELYILFMRNTYLESLKVYHSPESGLQQYAV